MHYVQIYKFSYVINNSAVVVTICNDIFGMRNKIKYKNKNNRNDLQNENHSAFKSFKSKIYSCCYMLFTANM